MIVEEIGMISWLCGHTGRDKTRNEVIRDKVGVTPVKMRESKLRLFGHFRRRTPYAPVRRCEKIISSDAGGGRELG